ncbi:MAG TPA: transcriptional regulator [Bacillota bacterium]|nr:transcriptional regulator [Bacillota bacterium]HOB87345.1 transcriptional regulator [Bacillota bacterium]HOP69935.1 transcriptional regulator [Bacillota bacterium]HPT34813.1 transcriptional regulator [Bacillota bacterium]HPZ64514.1 transcriptional regulator [Bacillota bacterium]
MQFEQVFRIGDKLVSFDRAVRIVKQVLELRAQGHSQQEVSRILNLDRSFISRLETAGEIRKGKRVAVIGFPVKNREQLVEICHDLGLDFYLILTDAQRWKLVEDRQAMDFFNEIMEIIAGLKNFDALVLLTSERWYRLAEAILDLQIIFVNLGPTPVKEDRFVDPERFREMLEQVIETNPEGEESS